MDKIKRLLGNNFNKYKTDIDQGFETLKAQSLCSNIESYTYYLEQAILAGLPVHNAIDLIESYLNNFSRLSFSDVLHVASAHFKVKDSFKQFSDFVSNLSKKSQEDKAKFFKKKYLKKTVQKDKRFFFSRKG